MSSPYVGEIRMFGGSFAPAGWAFCDGQLMPISQNDTLFNLIGTTYGGDGQETFALPALASRVPVHAGQGPGISQNYQIGETFGVESVTLTTQQIPIHNHAFLCSLNAPAATDPTNQVIAQSLQIGMFTEDVANKQMNPATLQQQGGNQPHENMSPFLVVSFILSLFGIFPTQN
jgi:microcystin-dependent protein